MNKNEIYEIEISGITDDGSGVGRVSGMAVFVPYALLGEKVRVLIIKVLKNYAVGKVLDVIKPSENRLKAECPHFYLCGGCSYWNATYEEELLYKHKIVTDAIKRIGGIDIQIPEVIGASDITCYRNKAQFPVSSAGIGIYAKKSHRVIDIKSCLIQSKETEKIISAVRLWMEKLNIAPYNEEDNSGNLRHIYTRSGKNEIMVVLVTKEEKIENKELLIKLLKDTDEKIVSIMQNINEKQTNVVLGKKIKTLWGKDFIVDSIGDVKFKISPFSFYQVNNNQTKVLYDLVKEYSTVKNTDVVWDMYCGIGSIGLYAAQNAKKIVGVEIVESAIKNAKENAKLNNLYNTEYFVGPAEDVAPKLLSKGLKPDVIYLDPPRKGCDKKLLDTVIGTKAKKIVYVSCKSSTLARDLEYLKKSGYNIEKIQPVDLFPRTPHVECCVLLCRI